MPQQKTKKVAKLKAGEPQEKKSSALKAYLDDLGAEQRNWHRWVVREEGGHGHYHYDVCVIQVDKLNCTIKCSDDTFAPSAEQLKAIEAELKARKVWPFSKPVPEHEVHALRNRIEQDHGRTDPTLFVFRDAEGHVLFVQERIFEGLGKKRDVPWSYWVEGLAGSWQMAEPEGLLPLYGQEQLPNAKTIMLHEGAKTAQQVQQMCSYDGWDDACPWLSSLRGMAHLGWPGGAPNPHRVDWDPIKKLDPKVRVIVVCDHDALGENAAPKISKLLQRPVFMVRFGREFPHAFDLADRFPESLFETRKGGKRVYVGPSLDDCTEPATWATRKIKTKAGKYVTELRPEFVEQWWYTVRPEAFIHRGQLSRRYTRDEFNAAVAAFSEISNVAAALRKSVSAKAETITYEPGRPSGRVSTNGVQAVNVFMPSEYAPKAAWEGWEINEEAGKGSDKEVKLFLEFVRYLVPEEADQFQLLRWIATLVARPDIRMTYGILLISAMQGVGKTTLVEQILRPLVGPHNCSFPSASEAADSNYTGWLAYKRLVCIAEIYDGHQAAAYNRLKALVTDEHVRVNEKYERAFELLNAATFFASSNSSRALKLDDQDRRWFVPGVTEERWPDEKFKELRAWLRSRGLAAIMKWAYRFVQIPDNVVSTGQHAPQSVAKRNAIEDGYSEGEKLINQLGTLLAERGKVSEKIVVTLEEVRDWLMAQKAKRNPSEFGAHGHLKLENPQKIAAMFRACGLLVPSRRFIRQGKRVSVVATFDIGEVIAWTDLAPHFRSVVTIAPPAM